MQRLVAVSLVVVALAGSLHLFAADETVKVDGGQVAGVEVDGVRVFKGIPFAAPPVGELRWKPPQPVVPWNGVRKADAYGPRCMQLPYPAESPYLTDPEPVNEDCLYLNVWTAAATNEKRPVMVWIYGGRWSRGSASQARSGVFAYDGAALAKKGPVVVTVNYRVGPLGFLAHPELTAESPQHSSGNYAILDNIAALRWVQKNIAAFGGNPGNVTIFGESAGSVNVSILQATPLAKGLFHRVIGQSGAGFVPTSTLRPVFDPTRTLRQAQENGREFARATGANSLKELRSVPAERLVAVASFSSTPHVDGWVLPADVRTIFTRKNHNLVPALVGSNADEWTMFSNPATFPKTMEEFRKRIETQFPGHAAEFETVYPVRREADIAGAMLALARDEFFTLQMRTWARMVTVGGQKAFLYQFTRVPPGPNAKAWGAYHAAEIPYVFGNLRDPAFAYTDTDRSLSDVMSSYWINFARTGDPNGTGMPVWTPYDPAAEPYLDLGDTVQLKHHLLKAQLDFLERAHARSIAK